jgi:hypothetical protein
MIWKKFPMKKLLTLLIVLLASTHALAQDGFSSVEERMTGKEFTDAGLDKLTDAELAALNDWLRDHSVATLEDKVAGRQSSSGAVIAANELADGSDRRGFEGKVTDTTTIVSRMIGEFDGWDNETVFKLENGMVWKQAQTDKYYAKTLVNPMVTIKAGMFGAWRLSVEGYNKSVKVERIQ